MMNLDQARAGGEGVLSSKVKSDGKDKNVDTPALFQTQESPLKVSIPDGWSVKGEGNAKRMG